MKVGIYDESLVDPQPTVAVVEAETAGAALRAYGAVCVREHSISACGHDYYAGHWRDLAAVELTAEEARADLVV